MGFRRVDSTTVVDDAGNSFWLPDLGTPEFGEQPVAPSGPSIFDQAPSQAPIPAALPVPSGAPPELTTANALVPPGQNPPSDMPIPGMETPGQGMGPASQPPQGQPPAPGPQPEPGQQDPLSLRGLPPAPRNPREAQAQEAQGFQDATQAAVRATGDEQTAAEAQAQRTADAAWGQVEEHDKTRAATDALYQAAAQRADQQTADWLKTNQKIAETKVDPKRMFHESSTFSKIAWIVSLVSGAMSAGADQSKNIGLKLLDEAIAEDVAIQKDSIARKMQASQAEGQMLFRRQDRDLAHVKDTEAAMWQRWDAVGRHAMAKAAMPGSEDRKAALSKVVALAEDKKVGILQTRAERAHRDAQAAAERQVQMAQLAENRRQANARLAEDKRQHGIDTQKAYDLAQMQLQAGADKAGAKGNADDRVLPKSTGFRLVGPGGADAGEITVSKEQYNDVSKAAQMASDKATALQNLRGAMVNADGSARVFNSDAELQSTLNQAVGPVAKQINGGGAMTEQDIARAYQVVVGYDPQSLFSKIKGPNKKEVLDLIDKQIQQLPEKAANDIAIASGRALPQGVSIRFTPNERLGYRDTPTPDAEGALVAAGGQTQPRKHPTSVDEYRKALETEKQSGKGSVLHKLPPDLDALVREAENVAKTKSPSGAKSIWEGKQKQINQWLQDHAAEPTAKDMAADARVRLMAANEDAQIHGTKLGPLVITTAQSRAQGMTSAEAAEHLKKQAKRQGFDLTGPELANAIEAAETLAKRFRNYETPTTEDLKKALGE